MLFYKNKFGYMICTDLTVDTTQLDQVKVIDTEEEAEKIFREINETETEDGVFIPEIVFDAETNRLLAEQLNTMLVEVKTPIEEYINQYTV
ncbi:hypothetical protein [Pseudoalteromonas marina]|uniref:Uncharacterized protein n=1 Tax=Pseudoalteromonas marina TaxID=267375 RepID=A0ABT9FCB5_9GAMM|nr:hypothetical protein [Pseudoalteromonas marina]MDP2564432.1 hypothetical protein [Pseudoalteromonas marina]